MNTKEYENICNSTKNLDNLDQDQLKAYLSIGLAGEVGEVLNILKKQLYYTQYDLNFIQLQDELGDCLYYLTNLVTECGWSLEDIMENNSKKVERILARRIVGE